MTDVDIVVVGGGHAGCEAAHTAARLGLRAMLVTMELDAIARMSCNPSIGGPAKGHITREIGALGGLQAAVTDATYLNLRLLNTGKGASVQALRAQSDRNAYSREMRRRLALTPGLVLVEGEVARILTSGSENSPRVAGVALGDGREFAATRVVICPGTFTRGQCFIGREVIAGGRWGEAAAAALGAGFDRLGLRLHRLKTGTSPRIARDSVDYTAVTPQLSEWRGSAFGVYAPAPLPGWFLPCWLTRTTAATHALITARRMESALISGLISGAGPRYCPSIEDKLQRFPTAGAHPVFIEPDGLDVDVLYLQGLATSLSRDVQDKFLTTIPGLENARIVKHGYAVEYDAINPVDLTPQLESRQIGGLYCAGQFNGTSGYEEAAAQGLFAGANAALSLLGRAPLPLTRANSYIGVLVDDLTTRGTEEPYRMLTSRAEHRLLLRHDNTILRLGPVARDCGLLDGNQLQVLDSVRSRITAVQTQLAEQRVSPARQAELGLATRLPQGIRAGDLVRRGASVGQALDTVARPVGDPPAALAEFIAAAAAQHVEVELRYAGYLERARQEVARVQSQESRGIPVDFDFHAVDGILKATREHLSRIRPATLGQAGRVPGVTPADLANLLVALQRHG